MKKLLTILMLFTASLPLWAYDLEVDGIYYNKIVSTSTVQVTNYDSQANSNSYSGTVVIPETVSVNGVTYKVTSIGAYAFVDCENLTAIEIPGTVTEIGTNAFLHCYGLSSVTIADGETTLELANYQAGNWPRGLFFDCPIETLYLGRDLSYDINTQEGITRTPFSQITELTTLTIGNNVTKIGVDAFVDCSGLTSVIIPNNITSIGGGAFEGCTGLTEVIIPESVQQILGNTFKNCTALTSVTIPNSVTSIGNYAFEGCTKLSTITCNATTPPAVEENSFPSYDVTLDIPTESLSLYLEHPVWSKFKFAITTLPLYYKVIDANNKYVEVINDASYASYNGPVVIPSTTVIDGVTYTVTSIGTYAFRDCTGLTLVAIPESVTSIDDYAFMGCTGLTSIAIPESVTSIGDYAFDSCTGLSYATFLNSVASIGNNAFYKCSSLTEVTLGNSVTSIGNDAFNYCKGLTSIIIPNSVTTIGNNAFYCCTGLTEVTLGNSVTSIGSGAFVGCTGLTSVTIPASVTSIGGNAFGDCSALKEFIIEDGESVLDLAVPFSRTYITSLYLGRTLSYSGGDFSFSSLASLTIGNKVTSIGRSAFKGGYSCKLRGQLELPASLDSIASNAFASTQYTLCRIQAKEPPVVVDAAALGNITFVRVPQGSRAAYKAANVWKDLTIVEEDPEYEVEITVTEPGKLSQDIVMEYMIVPQSVTKLKVHGTINVEDFKQMRTNMTSCYSIDLSDADCVALPDSAFEGKYYLTELILPNNCTSIGKAAFVNCTGLDSIVIPDNVTVIGNDVFNGCSALKSVIIPNGVTSIGNNAFQNCKSLTSVTIPNSVTSLGVYAFYYCENLQTIQLSQSLTVIKSYTFSNCGLKEISIPGSVTSIENQAFTSCSSLENLVFEDSEKTLNLGCNKDSGTDYTQGQGLFYNCPIQTLYIGRNLSYNTSKSCGYSPFCGLETNAWGTVLQNGKISSVAFGDKVTNIGERLLAGNPNLKSIKMGANISSISTYAFSGDTLDVDYSNLSVLYKCGDVINSAHKVNLYHNGVPLTHIDLPDNMTTVKTNQFKNIINLESVNIPNSVKSIKANAFDGCISLKSVSFSDSITTVGNQAFVGCVSLTTVNLPDTLTTIGSQAFKGCTSLTTVNLSDTLQSIGDEAFYGCSALANITCPALVPPTVGTDGFEGVDNYTCILTIPGDSLINYMLAEHWGAFIQKRKRIDVDVETPVVDEGESEGESGSEGDGNTGTGTGNHCGGHIWYDRDWHKHHRGHHAPRRYAAAEEEIAVSGIDATIGDGLSLFIATDSVVTFLIEPEEGYNIGSVRYGGVDVTDQLNNGVFTTSAVSANTKLEVSFVEGEAPEAPVVAGDANDDATVNISDVVVIVNYILGDESGVTSVDNADVNKDGVINIGDVPGVVNIILSASVQAAPIRYEGAEGVLSMNDVIIAQGETTGIEVSLDNAVPYTAFQMDVTLPEGLTANDITLSNRISSTHSLMWRMQEDNTLRVVVFAPDNSTIADNSGALFTIDVTAGSAFEGGHIVADNTIFTARDLTMHYLDGATATAINPAGVDGIYTADRIYTIGRTLVIESTCNQAAYITTTGGVMRAVELQAGRNEIAMLHQGLYIVVVGSETQKVIIR